MKRFFKNITDWYFTKKAVPYWFILLLDCFLVFLNGWIALFLTRPQAFVNDVLFWSNFSKMQYWIPYVSGDDEHELVSDFKAFALDERIALAPVIDISDGMI